jgi:hypothetical protein
MTRLGKATRLKTIADNLDRPDAAKGETVTVVGGAFEGWSGTIVDFDGIWRSIKVA